MGAYLSARQAAKVCGVSEKTVRNWIVTGRISARRSAAGFRIDPDQLPRQTAEPTPNGADSAPSAQHANPDTAPVMLELVRLVAKLQEENRVMAGRIGWLEAQVEHLKALPGPAETAPGREPDHVSAAAAQEPSAPKRAWWLRWLPA